MQTSCASNHGRMSDSSVFINDMVTLQTYAGGRDDNPRHVATAVCTLLLGDSEGAEAALGLGPGSTPRCERSVLQFIKVRATPAQRHCDEQNRSNSAQVSSLLDFLPASFIRR